MSKSTQTVLMLAVCFLGLTLVHAAMQIEEMRAQNLEIKAKCGVVK